MRSNCDVTTIILNFYNSPIQLLTAVHTCQRIFPHTFKTAFKTEYIHTRRTFCHALKSTLRLTRCLDYPNQMLYNKEANNNRMQFANTIIHFLKKGSIDIQYFHFPLGHRRSCYPDSRSASR